MAGRRAVRGRGARRSRRGCSSARWSRSRCGTREAQAAARNGARGGRRVGAEPRRSIAAPVVAAGTTYQMLRSVAVLAGHDMLSALAFNLWWIVSYLFVAAAARGDGLRAGFSPSRDRDPRVRDGPRVSESARHRPAAGGRSRPVGAQAARATRRDLGLQTAFAAFVVVAYFTLSVQVHENHFFLALPLLAVAAALRPAFAPVFAALSVTFALNLYLPFGVRGDGAPEPSGRRSPSIPASSSLSSPARCAHGWQPSWRANAPAWCRLGNADCGDAGAGVRRGMRRYPARPIAGRTLRDRCCFAVAAVVNLAAGVALALRDPRRASDLWTMADWCRAWLIDGASLYSAADAATDYPPNAIVLLSPLALVPPRWLVPLWTAGAVALAPVLPWLVLRCASRRRRPLALAVPALLYLCWAAPRTLLQFSVLSLTLAFAAILLVDSSPARRRCRARPGAVQAAHRRADRAVDAGHRPPASADRRRGRRLPRRWRCTTLRRRRTPADDGRLGGGR